jgi:hypothetical protein
MNAPARTQLRCLDCAALLYTDPTSSDPVDQWGERTCSASYRDHVPDLPYTPVRADGPAAPATSTNTFDRLRRTAASCRTACGGLNPAGAGALVDAPPPHQGRSASSASLRDRPRAALDPGDPARRLPDALRAGATNAPARPESGPTTTT